MFQALFKAWPNNNPEGVNQYTRPGRPAQPRTPRAEDEAWALTEMINANHRRMSRGQLTGLMERLGVVGGTERITLKERQMFSEIFKIGNGNNQWTKDGQGKDSGKSGGSSEGAPTNTEKSEGLATVFKAYKWKPEDEKPKTMQKAVDDYLGFSTAGSPHERRSQGLSKAFGG